MKQVLLAENEPSLAQSLHDMLLFRGLRVTHVPTVAGAFEQLDHQHFDLLIVDRMLDDGDGLDIIEYVHELARDSQILCLSQKNLVTDRITGLQKGADDYLGKPFSSAELLLRVERLLTTYKLPSEQKIELGEVIFLPQRGELQLPDQKVKLRRREVEILKCLVRFRNRVVSRETLIDQIWKGSSKSPTYTTLDVYIRRLRVLLGKYHKLIKTVRGFGYTLVLQRQADHKDAALTHKTSNR